MRDGRHVPGALFPGQNAASVAWRCSHEQEHPPVCVAQVIASELFEFNKYSGVSRIYMLDDDKMPE